MAPVRRFDHVGITVADLDSVAAFFVGLGFEIEGRMPMEGDFVDTVIGLPDSRSEIVMPLDAILGRLAADGNRLVGGVGRYEDIWRMAYVRGPEGIIVSLAQRID